MADLADNRSNEVESPTRHLDRLYQFAQTLTLDPERASRLVEKTYERAKDDDPATGDRDDIHRMLRLMRWIQEEEDPSTAPSGEGSRLLRQEVAMDVIDQKMGVAISLLPVRYRAILGLVELQGQSCTDAGYVLDLDSDVACEEHRQARAELERILRQALTPAEEHLIFSALSGNWIGAALHRVSDRSFSTLPPTLRANVEHLVDPVSETVFPPAKTEPAPETRRAVTSRRERRRSDKSLTYVLVAVTVIFAAGLIGYFTSRSVSEQVEKDLLTLSIEQLEELEPVFRPGNNEQAERFALDRLGTRILLPEIDQATLTGVAVARFAPDSEAPVFLYEDHVSGSSFVLYAYSYAFLDRNESRIELGTDILRQIQEERHFDLHDLGTSQVLVWRNRDDIYVAIVGGNAEELRDRISYPS